jgi:hypothetical protein
VEHPTSAESNTPTINHSKHSAAFSKRCPPKHRHKTRPRDLPPRPHLQPTAVNVPSSNSTRSFQLMAQTRHVTCHKAPRQITSDQQRPPAHATEKPTVDQDHHRPPPRHYNPLVVITILWYSVTMTAMPSSPSLSKLAKPVS